MKCNWCGRGEGRNYTIDKKTGLAYYYYCQICVGNFKENPFKLYPRDKEWLKQRESTVSRKNSFEVLKDFQEHPYIYLAKKYLMEDNHAELVKLLEEFLEQAKKNAKKEQSNIENHKHKYLHQNGTFNCKICGRDIREQSFDLICNHTGMIITQVEGWEIHFCPDCKFWNASEYIEEPLEELLKEQEEE